MIDLDLHHHGWQHCKCACWKVQCGFALLWAACGVKRAGRPTLASTTSVPAFWMRSVSFLASSSLMFTAGWDCTVGRREHKKQLPSYSAVLDFGQGLGCAPAVLQGCCCKVAH